ncbi:hypothetical protein GJ496_009158 [Pomphorhynchus laevis]|nr:hypothetical protein GJ496_009158 [Pomphorhynchus laevis]
MGKKFLILYEHASGYALLRIQQFEEIGAQIPEVEATMTDPTLFLSACKLVAFSPFTSGLNALENANAISEGALSDDLRLFISSNIPEQKKSKIILGVGGTKLAQTINEEMGIAVKTTDAVPEIMRGIRLHFHLIIKGLTDVAEQQAQLGLSHAYSRSKVKFNVNRVDNMIIQSIALIDQLDKDINTFAMRIREWYSYHFPELYKIVPDNYNYSKAVRFICNRKNLTLESQKQLEEMLLDSAKAQDIMDASRSSIGMDISDIDIENIQLFCDRVISLYEYRMKLQEYLKSKMANIAPNLTAIIGEHVGARLISHAGSLTNLAKYPASTIQILGAEKALFRAIKNRTATPKYGILFHASMIGKATKENKGRVSRSLANKCAIASRIDCFSDVPTSFFGNVLKDLVETRLRYHEGGCIGDKPPLTSDVLGAASEQANVEREIIRKRERKRAKKEAKKSKEGTVDGHDELQMEVDTLGNSSNLITSEKKKKKKRSDLTDNDLTSPSIKESKKKKVAHEELVPALSKMSVEDGIKH